MEEIRIRRTEPGDARAIQQIFDSEAIYSQTLQLPNPSVQMWEERLNNSSDQLHGFVALIGDEVVGNVSVAVEARVRRRHAAHLGLVVKDTQFRRGIGHRLLNHVTDLCDNWMGIRRIELTVFSDNEPAIALYRRFDFVEEGVAKGYALRNGQYADVLYMARIHVPD